MSNEKLLLEFLSAPLDSGDEIFEKFASLPGAVVGVGENPFQRFVYIPGTRNDRVLLTAHMDTVWDEGYTKFTSYKPHNHGIKFENGIFSSTDPKCGIGADDRAGCAMLWRLKDSGHSLLVLDGEEGGKMGAWYLKRSHPRLYREINRHSYMIALDLRLESTLSFRQVYNTSSFKTFVKEETGFEDFEYGGCDLQVLCKTVCGVNVGVGYCNHHSVSEMLSLSAWENTLNTLEALLAKPQRKYKTKYVKRQIKSLRELVGKILRKLRLRK